MKNLIAWLADIVSGWSCVPCRTCGGDQTRGWHLHDRMTAEPARDTTNDIAALTTIAARLIRSAYDDDPERMTAALQRESIAVKAIADRLAAHTSHQQDRLAAAWDKGLAAGSALASHPDAARLTPLNPYRAALATNPGQEEGT